MIITHVISSLTTGGAQRIVADLLPEIAAASGVEVQLVVFSRSGSDLEAKLLASPRIKTSFLDISSRHPDGWRRLRPYIKEADIVHAHLFPVNYQVALANIGIGKPLVFTEHSTHNKRRDHRWLRIPEKWMYGRYDRIVAISNGVGEALAGWIGTPTDDPRIKVIANGIDIKRFSESRPPTGNSFGREGRAILMVSRFTAAKDHASVVKSLRHIKADDAFVAFAGEGPTLDSVRELAGREGVADRVVFLGNRTDIPELVKSASVGVQASHWEGFGLTVVEMMAGGLPVVASDVSGLREIVGDKGLLVQPGNAGALAEAFDRILGDTTLSGRMSREGMEYARQFSIGKCAERHIDMYKEIARQELRPLRSSRS